MPTVNKLYNDFEANLGKPKEVIKLDDSSETDTIDNMLTTERKLNTDDSGSSEGTVTNTPARLFTGFSF